MMFTIVIVLVVLLLILAIVINGYQQHREKLEAEKRTEMTKQKSIIDETEDVIMASANLPTSPKLFEVMQRRVVNALKVIYDLDPKATGVKQRLKDAEAQLKQLCNAADSGEQGNISLPDNDKQIIVFIQCLKKQRAILRAEHGKGKVDTQSFSKEDKRIDQLQLRVNVETLERRAKAALSGGMVGSARQYLEKAIAALSATPINDEYVATAKARLDEKLYNIQENLSKANADDAAKRAEEERDELDELFAPKKKW
ncbi:MAG: hypothetical protein ACFHVJ_12920 [Aestuariibacter sp.]